MTQRIKAGIGEVGMAPIATNEWPCKYVSRAAKNPQRSEPLSSNHW
jgi:hypothetical protein